MKASRRAWVLSVPGRQVECTQNLSCTYVSCCLPRRSADVLVALQKGSTFYVLENIDIMITL